MAPTSFNMKPFITLGALMWCAVGTAAEERVYPLREPEFSISMNGD
jgi:hypothetical protein